MELLIKFSYGGQKMKRLGIFFAVFGLFILALSCRTFAFPTVYPTGTTIYKPDKCWNGYTIYGYGSLPGAKKKVVARLIDMNGRVVKKWEGIHGFPYKILPGGYLMGFSGYHTKTNDLLQVDWDGQVVWKFPDAKAHHDYQREGNPVGYYAPGMAPFVDKGKTLINAWNGVKDCWLTEVSWDGKVLWKWKANDHADEIKKGGGPPTINTASWLGPNKWYDAGDERFNPDNIICDNTFGDVIFIISRKTGKIVWKVGPDYHDAPELKKLGLNLEGWGGGFVGGMLHNAHMIPKGLPGEGNILVFNNGRPYSLVTEFDPVTRKVVWEYSGEAIGYGPSHSMAHKFFSPTISGMQRLPNGNTLICEGDGGRLFEVTTRLEIVWEYINPYNEYRWRPGWKLTNNVYRAYRVPFEWIPQLKKPVAKPVTPPDNSEFRIEPEHGVY